uniref:Uncharacterized protein n=1 Tax=Leersia perrieri TaxID=77586 RepID=A0A0D9V0I7_9ORYZ
MLCILCSELPLLPTRNSFAFSVLTCAWSVLRLGPHHICISSRSNHATPPPNRPAQPPLLYRAGHRRPPAPRRAGLQRPPAVQPRRCRPVSRCRSLDSDPSQEPTPVPTTDRRLQRTLPPPAPPVHATSARVFF